jgi:hypothetical protein
MKNGLHIGDKHRCIVEDTVPDYGFDVVAWKKTALRVESLARKSAFVESERNNTCDADEKG